MQVYSVVRRILFGENILQTARIYSKATGKSTLLAVCSLDSLQVLPVCSINYVAAGLLLILPSAIPHIYRLYLWHKRKGKG